MIIGSHVSFKKDTQLVGSVEETLSYGANTFMFYTGAPQNTVRNKIDNEKTIKAIELMKENNLISSNIDYFIPHQSNQRMIDALAQRLGFEESKIISNIEHYGNMSAASIPVAIRESIDNGNLKLPATVILSAFGAGMTAGNAIVKLNENI